MQLLPVSGAGLAGVEGGLEAGLALRPGHQAQVNLTEEWVQIKYLIVFYVFMIFLAVYLLGDELEGAIDLVLAPASHVAPHAAAVAEDVAELAAAGGEARRVHVGGGEADVTVHGQQGYVVTQPGDHCHDNDDH